MGSKPKNKMPIADRAKQFMPFAALKGLPEALAARENILTSCADSSAETKKQPDRYDFPYRSDLSYPAD